MDEATLHAIEARATEVLMDQLRGRSAPQSAAQGASQIAGQRGQDASLIRRPGSANTSSEQRNPTPQARQGDFTNSQARQLEHAMQQYAQGAQNISPELADGLGRAEQLRLQMAMVQRRRKEEREAQERKSEEQRLLQQQLAHKKQAEEARLMAERRRLEEERLRAANWAQLQRQLNLQQTQHFQHMQAQQQILASSGAAAAVAVATNQVAQQLAADRARLEAMLQQSIHRQVQRESSLQAAARQRPAQRVKQQQPGQLPEEEKDGEAELLEDEEDIHTYSSYTAKKVRELYSDMDLVHHPDPLVETASLASVQLPDLDRSKHYLASLEDDIKAGRLSDAQVESIVYAWAKFTGPALPDQQRRGFFLGDGAGVGKGRTIAGLVKQHWNSGGKYILWVSVSQDLRRDARRDLDDLEAKAINIYEPSGTKHIPNFDFKGVVFITYSLLRSGIPVQKRTKRKKTPKARGSRVDLLAGEASRASPAASGSEGEGNEDDEAEDTLEIDNLPASSRLAQIMNWLERGGDDGALIIFDESHRAKNLIPETGNATTQTARCVLHLQDKLPRAKVLYSSATGASEPRNLAYMTRLWGTRETLTMVNMLSDGKLGAMELAAMSLKATGSYLARTLSYEGADFDLARVEVPPVLRLMYDRSVLFWTLLYKLMVQVGGEKKWRAQYWGAHQRFYRSMLMATKVPECAKVALQAVRDGKSAVIGLQSTGEAATEQLLKVSEALDDLVSAPTQILDSFLRNNFPLSNPEVEAWERIGSLETLEYYVMAARKAYGRLPRVQEVVRKHQRQARTAVAGEQTPGGGFSGLIRDEIDSEDEALMNGSYISHINDPSFRLTDDQWEELEMAKEAAAERLRNPNSSRRDAPGRVAAARAVQQAKEHRDRLRACISLVEARAGATSGAAPGSGGRSTAVVAAAGTAAALATPVERNNNVTRATAPEPVFIDLCGDTTDEEDALIPVPPPVAAPAAAPHAAAPAPAAADRACMLCDFPADVAMATCKECKGRVHAACLDLWEVPVDFTCDTCALKEPAASPSHDQPTAGPGTAIKSEPGTAARPFIKPEPGTVGAARVKSEPGLRATPAGNGSDMLDSDDDGADLADEELETKSPAQLRVLLQRAERTLAAAEHKLDEMDAPVEDLPTRRTSPNTNTNNNQRRSKAGKKKAAESAAAGGSGNRGGSSGAGGRSTSNAGSFDDDDPMETDPAPADPFAAYLGTMDGRGGGSTSSNANRDLSERLRNMRGWLLEIVIDDLELPANPLDDLIERLGGQSKVAELTGRRGFIERDELGVVKYTQRSSGEGPAREINLREKDKFMNGTKRIAIISDAASTGISLQADRRVASRDLRRCHLTLELPWSADKAIQQFGRSHRANQVSAPEYRILVTPCGGEYRFASAAAKRLQSLGALLRGDRNAVGAGAELKAFDVDTEAGSEALNAVMRCFTAESSPLPGVKIPQMPEEFGLPASGPVDENDARNILAAPFFVHFRRKLEELSLLAPDAGGGFKMLQKARLRISVFLNRLLGLRMVEQDLLFNFFADMLDATVSKLKSEGKYDTGIVSLTGRQISAVQVENVHTDRDSGAKVDRVTLAVDGGLTFEEAEALLAEAKQRMSRFLTEGRTHLSGFYLLKVSNVLSGVRRKRIVLATEVLDNASVGLRPGNIKLRIQIPYGQEKLEVIDMNRFRQDWAPKMVQTMEEAKEVWDAWFNYTATKCQHGDGCRLKGGNCQRGVRFTNRHLLCGAVLEHFQRLKDLHESSGHATVKTRTVKTFSSVTKTWEEEKRTYKEPLQVRRAIIKIPVSSGEGDNLLADGEPVVGLMAVNEEEMDYLAEHMVPSSNPAEDVLRAAYGTNYMNPEAVLGLQAGAMPMGRSRGGKKPKQFR